MGGQGTRAVDAARRSGIEHRVHAYPHDPRAAQERGGPGFALEAATALGVDPGRVFKTLVARLVDRLAIAIVPAATVVDLRALAAAAGVRSAELAPPADAERATGYVLGGISPLGLRREMAAFIDAAALDHPTILVSAGRRGLELELAPADLVRLLDATVADIARPGSGR